MQAAEIIGMAVGIFAILAAILSGLIWVIKAQVSMGREFKPNGGHSTRDMLNEIKIDVREIRARLDDHIEWHIEN